MTEEKNEKQPKKEEKLTCPTETYLDKDGKWKTKYKPGTECDRVVSEILDSLPPQAKKYFEKHVIPEESSEESNLEGHDQ